METPTDLTHASRDDLLRLLAAQQATIAQQAVTIAALERRIADLERRLGSSKGQGMPGTKAQQVPPAPKRPRKRRSQHFVRRRALPTRQVVHALDQCPDCATRLQGGWVQRRREVIDLPVVPAETVEHVFVQRQCPCCGRRWLPTDALAGVVAGRQRLGVGLVSLIATLREEGRLPVRTIQWYLRTVHQLSLSVGTIVGASQRLAQAGAAAVATIREQVRASPAVAADETGWREGGRNGYVWTFSTPTAQYFVYGRRTKAVVDAVLGEAFCGVIGCDFYAACHHYAGRKQRCWAHLLRDLHDLTHLYPQDACLTTWAAAVHTLVQEARAWHPATQRQRLAAQQGYEQQLLALCAPFLDDPLAVQRKLCRRIARFLPELFVFVAEPDVPADNNGAERSLRHLVTSRKISGGTRSPLGTATKMTLASLFGTWRAQGLDPLHQCRRLLTSPHL
jgi:hypothetical protein